MKEIRRRKVLALVMTISLILGMGFNSNPNIAAASGAAPVDDSISSFAVTEVTGSAITFYIGGENALDTNNGTSSATPFATLAQAADATRAADREVVHDSEGYEVYQFIVQGDTSELKEIKIGDKTTKVKAIILGNAVSGSAIVCRDPSFTYGSMIRIISNAYVTLGDASDTSIASDSNLIFDNGNFSMDDSIIENDSNLILYSGVTLQNQKSTGFNNYGSAIDNYGNFDMYGGTINGYTTDGNGGGVGNYETFHMHGGSITNNTTSQNGGGIYNQGNFIMTGGIIDSNSASKGNAIYQGGGSIMISGEATIVGSKNQDIYLEKSAITIGADLSTSETIMITLPSYYEGAQILSGTPELIANNCSKFALSDASAKYSINNGGYVSYVGVEGTYYVDETNGSDANSGSAGLPFSTLQKAVSEIKSNSGKGTIILQSDILLKQTVVINGAIRIIGDGTNVYEIKRDVSALPDSFSGYYLDDVNFKENMFIVLGSLILGEDSDNGDDNNSTLIFNGGGVDAKFSYPCELFNNLGALTIYSGVEITGGYDGAVYNEGTFVMEGGKLCNNKGIHGVIGNDGIFNMNGGSVTNNSDCGVTNGWNFTMSGDASISYNTSEYVSGVYNYGNFTMSGNSIINDNTGGEISGVCNHENFTMLGGMIKNNIVTAADYGNGIVSYGGTLTMYGDARVDSSNYIYMEENNQEGITCLSGKIIIDGSFTGSDSIAHIITYTYDSNTEIYSESITLGLKVLFSGNNYTFTSKDASRFLMVAAGYGINQQGKIAKLLPEGAITLTVGDIYYDGTEKSVAGITVKDCSITLVEDIDYTVSYENNVNAGNNATVIITGINNYAGIQNISFSILPNPTPDSPAAPITVPTTTTMPTPTPTPALSSYTIDLEGGKGEVAVTISETDTNGIVNVTYELPVDILEEIGEGGEEPIHVTLNITSDQLVGQMNEEGTKGVEIAIHAPDRLLSSDNINTNIILESELVESASKNGIDITIKVTDDNGKEQYSWTFAGDDLANSAQQVSDVNLSLKVEAINNTQLYDIISGDRSAGESNSEGDSSQGLVINFEHTGVLPSQATVRIYIGDMEGFDPGDRVYLYYYNSQTGKLETLPFSSGYYMDEYGYITISLIHCSEYVLMPQAADESVVTSLKNQISVTPLKQTLYVGGSKASGSEIQVVLPDTLQIDDGSKIIKSAVGKVTVTYKSRNRKVATVSSDGKVTAVGVGKVKIITTIKLYSGKTRLVNTIITVKEPTIKLKNSI